jgi:hypothetical protein
MSQSDNIWEYYARDGGVFHPHDAPNYITQQYIQHLEDECERLKSEVDELRKRLRGD